jgi:hypothetical protein
MKLGLGVVMCTKASFAHFTNIKSIEQVLGPHFFFGYFVVGFILALLFFFFGKFFFFYFFLINFFL